MNQASKRRSRPAPDAENMKHIFLKLNEAIAAEYISHSNLSLNQNEREPWEVTLVARDGAVHILRFLRVWFDLPHTVFFSAASYLDQFLGKLKVQEKYLNCLTISCFYVAAAAEGFNIDTHQLVSVSQSKCSVKDMLRMADIVKQKLNTSGRAITCADFLIIFVEILELLAVQWDAEILLSKMIQKEQLLTRLEVLVADSSCVSFRPPILALVLLHVEFERFMTNGLPEKSVYYLEEMLQFVGVIGELRLACQITVPDLVDGLPHIANVLKQYDSQDKTKHCQNLLWRFSASTVAMSHRNRNFHLLLDTIDEQNQNM